MVIGMTATMPRSKNRAAGEKVTKPRARGGNTWAVGAYLKKLREDRGIGQEPLIREILQLKGGNVIMSLSTLVQIENGATKGSTASTIAAIRKAVGGDPYDIDALYDLPIPDENDETGIKASRLEGQARAIARQQMLGGTSAIQIVAGNVTPDVEKILNAVATNESLLRLAKELANDPKALKMVLAVLDARNSG